MPVSYYVKKLLRTQCKILNNSVPQGLDPLPSTRLRTVPNAIRTIQSIIEAQTFPLFETLLVTHSLVFPS